MPLRKFDDRDFDSFVRAKFEAAPPANFDAKAWSKLNAKKGGFKVKMWVAGTSVVLLILLSLWWWYPFGSQVNDKTNGEQSQLLSDSEQAVSPIANSPSINSGNSTIPEIKPSGNDDMNPQSIVENQDVNYADLVNNSDQNTASNTSNKQTVVKNYKLQSVESNILKSSNTDSKVKVGTVRDSGNITNNKINQTLKKTESITENQNVTSSYKVQNQDNREDENLRGSKEYEPNGIFVKPIKDSEGFNFSDSQKEKNYIKQVMNLRSGDDDEITNLVVEYLNSKDTSFLMPIPEIFITKSDDSYLYQESQYLDKKRNREEKGQLKNRFILSLLINTDLSTVKFDDFTSPGFGLGVRMSYKLRDRFTVNGGITKTTRIYDVTDREDYSLSQWIINNQGWPEGISAKCNITEIPIGLRYDLIKGKDWNFYGQLSSSTFLMDREFYDFKLTESQMQSGFLESWVIENKNKHVFNIIGATVGYEKYFTRRVGIGIEVYWQTTLNGIGVYSVNLNSLGNQIMLNYKF